MYLFIDLLHDETKRESYVCVTKCQGVSVLCKYAT